MNYKKRVLFMLVLTACVFSLVSCNSKEKDTGKKSEPTVTAEQRKEANREKAKKAR